MHVCTPFSAQMYSYIIYMLNIFLHVITHLVKCFHILHQIFRFGFMFFIQCRHYIQMKMCGSLLTFSTELNLTARLKLCSTCVISMCGVKSVMNFLAAAQQLGGRTVASQHQCLSVCFLSFIWLFCFVPTFYTHASQGRMEDSKLQRGMNVSVNDCLSVTSVMGDRVRVFNGSHPSSTG